MTDCDNGQEIRCINSLCHIFHFWSHGLLFVNVCQKMFTLLVHFLQMQFHQFHVPQMQHWGLVKPAQVLVHFNLCLWARVETLWMNDFSLINLNLFWKSWHKKICDEWVPMVIAPSIILLLKCSTFTACDLTYSSIMIYTVSEKAV